MMSSPIPRSSENSSPVIVVMDANRASRGSGSSLNALDWAIKYIVSPKDTVIVLGVLPDLGKKPAPACFPFHLTVRTSGVWMKLEFSGHGEMTPSELEEEIARKKDEFQNILQPFSRKCKKREAQLEPKLAAGYDPKIATIEEATKFDPRWIVLDNCLKKDKEYIYGHVACHVALVKAKDIATLMPSKIKGPKCEQWRTVCKKIDHDINSSTEEMKKGKGEARNTTVIDPCASKVVSPQTPRWFPLSWRTGYPRYFSLSELEAMTDGFADNSIFEVKRDRKFYKGVYQETPIVIVSFPGNDEQAVSLIKIISRVRHRSIVNLIGYCHSDDSTFLLCDYHTSTLEMKLQSDESAQDLSWKSRWQAAMEIGAALRYLHEEFGDGPVVDLSICLANVAMTRGSSAMLCIYKTRAKWLKNSIDFEGEEDSLSKRCRDEHLRADIQAYGVLLIELISGKSKFHFRERGDGKSLIDWAMPFLRKGLLREVTDPRLTECHDAGVDHMARAALLCLKNDPTQTQTISEVLAVVRGGQ